MSRLSRATVMPAKAKAEAELTRAVRRHRQISTSQAKSVNLSCGGRSPIKGPVPTEGRNIVVNRRLGWQPTAGYGIQIANLLILPLSVSSSTIKSQCFGVAGSRQAAATAAALSTGTYCAYLGRPARYRRVRRRRTCLEGEARQCTERTRKKKKTERKLRKKVVCGQCTIVHACVQTITCKHCPH